MKLKEFKKIGTSPKLQSEYVPRGEKNTKVQESRHAFWKKFMRGIQKRG